MQCVKRFQPKQIQLYFLFVVSILLIVSCLPTTSPTAIIAITSTATNTPGYLPTPADLEEATPLPTAVHITQPTVTPALFTPTLSPITASLTPELTPTFTSEQIADNLATLMAENGGCELPCWWGIVPGEAKIETIPERFIPLGLVELQEWEQLYVVLRTQRLVWLEEWKELHASGSGSSIFVWFDVKNDTIQSIEVRGAVQRAGSIEEFADDWGRYSLDQVLTRYGMPAHVFVYYPWLSGPGPAFYHLFLFYDALGIQIDYVGSAQHAVDGKSQACPLLSGMIEINLFLYQPGEIDNVIELIIPPETVSFVGPEDVVYDLMSWEQAVGTSLQSFYETFKDSDNNNCFDFMIYR